MKEQGSRAEEVKKRVALVIQSIRSTMGTSLGPKGMDKMITQGTNTTITNDGSTILKTMKMKHPIAQLICNISHSQDEQSGDGTTSITLLLCSFVEQALELTQRKIHPVIIAEAMEVAKNVCKDVLMANASKIEGHGDVRDCIRVSLNSKIVNAYIEKITEVTMKVIEHSTDKKTQDLKLSNVRRVKIKGNMEETEMVSGIVLSAPLKKNIKFVPRKMKVAIFQCTIGQSKPSIDSKIKIGNYESVEQVIREEKAHVLSLCKKIKEKEIDLIILQKSIIRESLSELGLHFLERMGIMIVDDVERKEIELCVEQMGITPVVDINEIQESMIGEYHVEELEGHVKISAGEGVCTVVLRGTDDVILEEVDRSFNDAVNVGRLAVKRPLITYGGGVSELLCYTELVKYSGSSNPKINYCVRELAKGLLIIPEMLAINAGANSITTVENLIKLHSQEKKTYGVSIKAVGEGNMKKENVVQPVDVSISGISGAFDGASTIIRIDDFIPASK
ncbi:T-complex protein 1 subunit delta [Nematocida minor]|uniref:T-complex protein 1 subunit delta n=1 Tax=Nematocida minor TaxID=1912983 RepID=UPI002220C930|nr:T-complex protein 1 subunit delta [Nematocida minor]KAI5192124.1 T-complex protein 1 subunit delta [Nematocida minor]